MDLFQINALADNYIYLIPFKENAIVIDPGSSKEVLEILKKEKLKLLYILNTHHHADHTGGNDELKEKTNCKIMSPEGENIKNTDKFLTDEEILKIGPFKIRCISTPGHTKKHMVYFFENKKVLFSGDTLFCGGCGKVFEGTMQDMISSLKKLSNLADDTKIYCGHNYIAKNLEFALSLEKDNEKIKERLKNAKKITCCTLKTEKETNPFLKTEDSNLKKAINLENASELDVFTKIRELKNEF